MKESQTKFRIAKLISKKLNGTILPKEEIVLENWLQQSSENRDLINRLTDPDYQKRGIALIDGLDYEKAWNKISTETIAQDSQNNRVGRSKLFKYAALMLPFVLAIGAWWHYSHLLAPVKTTNLHVVKRNVVHAGSKVAMLELSNGDQVVLNGKADAIKEGDNITIENKNDVLNYRSSGTANGTQAGFNKVSTPRGGEYQLVLADGTKVWLNASSSLRYPVKFNGALREVTLTGEAYFEVAKNPDHPFIVKSSKAEVRVLGTHFNVSGYDDEPDFKATLLEGSIMLTSGKNKGLLKPGQQGVIDRQDHYTLLENADINDAIAWKNGLIQFNDAPIEIIMRQVARWYDINIIYDGKLPDLRFTGRVARSVDLPVLIDIFKFQGIDLKINGKNLTISNTDMNKAKKL